MDLLVIPNIDNEYKKERAKDEYFFSSNFSSFFKRNFFVRPRCFYHSRMENLELYQDIAKRTDGDIYVGVVGPVRTGKSTFIKRFMDLLVIPNIENEYKKERAQDELPQSAAGRTIMTTEPKFVPNEAIEITLGDNIRFKTRLVDCVLLEIHKVICQKYY